MIRINLIYMCFRVNIHTTKQTEVSKMKHIELLDKAAENKQRFEEIEVNRTFGVYQRGAERM